MSKVSKNARRGSSKESFLCKECASVIKMKSAFIKGKMKNYAKCTGCGKEGRKIRDLKVNE